MLSDQNILLQIWSHAFSELHVPPVERPVLLTEHPLPTKADREKMTQIMLETFNVPAVFLAFKPVLSLYAAGKMNGVVLQSGYGATHALPCYEGNPLNDAALRLNLAGRDITDYLTKLLSGRGCSLPDHRIVNNIKESLCYVALDFEKEKATAASGSSVEKNYVLPDGKTIAIGSELFCCTEALFQPSLLGIDSPGIHQMMHNAIANCKENIRENLYANIVLAGGTTLLPKITERMEKELSAFAPPTADVKIMSSPAKAPHHSAFIGASILTSLPTFKDLWLSKKEYEEAGPSIVHTKFV